MILSIAAGSATAAPVRMSAHRRAGIRSSLLRQIKRHPSLIRSRSFFKRASLVDFVLPITVQLRQGTNPATTNLNNAIVDLGGSLGQRQVQLSGKLPGEIQFHDSFDGGALGNVDITLRPGGDLLTSSVPLLWNDQVSSAPATHWYDAGNGTGNPGCSDFTNANAVPSVGTATTTVGQTLDSPLSAFGRHGVPYFTTQANADAFDTTGNPGLIAGTVEEFPGADDVSLLHADNAAGDPYGIGADPDPFPAGTRPGGFPLVPNMRDTVLRTAPLHLHVSQPGTDFHEEGPSATQDGNGPQGSMDINLGKNGGQANLFGNIPGKDTQVFVTVSFQTKITSILREVDPDLGGLVAGQPYNYRSYNCRQFWTGTVTNYLNDITLVGGLHISPALTSDGHLRIAKASLASDQDWDVSLAACLLPYSSFSATSGVPTVPNDEFTGQSATGPSAINPEPTGVRCNQPPTPQVAAASVPPLSPLTDDVVTNTDGSQVSVSASITVPQIEADILIGDAN